MLFISIRNLIRCLQIRNICLQVTFNAFGGVYADDWKVSFMKFMRGPEAYPSRLMAWGGLHPGKGAHALQDAHTTDTPGDARPQC